MTFPNAGPGKAAHTQWVPTVVLDAGPIPHSELVRFDDPDIETGLENCGRSADGAVYRMIEISIEDLEDTHSFPFKWRPTTIIDALNRGETLPPIVVVQTDRGHGYGLIDGLNRTYAHWLTNRPTIRAYELLVG